MDVGAEGETRGNSIETLQQDITGQVALMQRLAFRVPTCHLKNDTERLSDLADAFHQIESTYRRIPSGHHLEIEVTPEAYYRFGGKDNYPWLRQDRLGNALRYYLTVGRFVEDRQTVGKDRTVLNLASISNSFQKVIPHFALPEVKSAFVVQGKDGLWPKDVLNIVIIPDQPRK